MKSDLSLPEQFHRSISIYLLFAIGLKGGVQLSQFSFAQLSDPIFATLILGVATTFSAFGAAYFIGRLALADSAALAAHYGSVSAVTFTAGLSFLNQANIDYPGYMTALFAIMEIPALLIAVGIFSLKKGRPLRTTVHEVFLGGTTLLLSGGLLIGLLGGKEHTAAIMPLFQDLFYGVLAFFILEMGLLVGDKIKDVRSIGTFLPLFSIIVPILNGLLGVFLGSIFSLSLGGCTLLAVMAASASYIAAPAVVRISIPEANPAYYVTAALVITFPFNITLGIPLYFWFAKLVLGVP